MSEPNLSRAERWAEYARRLDWAFASIGLLWAVVTSSLLGALLVFSAAHEAHIEALRAERARAVGADVVRQLAQSEPAAAALRKLVESARDAAPDIIEIEIFAANLTRVAAARRVGVGEPMPDIYRRQIDASPRTPWTVYLAERIAVVGLPAVHAGAAAWVCVNVRLPPAHESLLGLGDLPAVLGASAISLFWFLLLMRAPERRVRAAEYALARPRLSTQEMHALGLAAVGEALDQAEAGVALAVAQLEDGLADAN